MCAARAVDMKVVYYVGKLHTVLDFPPRPSRVMLVTDDIYQKTMRSESKRRHLTDNKNLESLQIQGLGKKYTMRYDILKISGEKENEQTITPRITKKI